MGKENINQNNQIVNLQDSKSSNQEGRRKRTAHFANAKLEYEHQRSQSSKNDPPHHKKSYSYLNSNPDNDISSKALEESNLMIENDTSHAEDDSEFDFIMSYHTSQHSQ